MKHIYQHVYLKNMYYQDYVACDFVCAVESRLEFKFFHPLSLSFSALALLLRICIRNNKTNSILLDVLMDVAYPILFAFGISIFHSPSHPYTIFMVLFSYAAFAINLIVTSLLRRNVCQCWFEFCLVIHIIAVVVQMYGCVVVFCCCALLLYFHDLV